MSDEYHPRFEEVDVELEPILRWMMGRATDSFRKPTDDSGIATAIFEVLSEEKFIATEGARREYAGPTLYEIVKQLRLVVVADVSHAENLRWRRVIKGIKPKKYIPENTLQAFVIIGLAIERAIIRDFPQLYIPEDTGKIVELHKPKK